MSDVIAVHAGEQRGPRLADAEVERRNQTCAATVQVDHSRIPIGSLSTEGRRAILGTVVDQEKLQILQGLIEDALNRQCKELLTVPRGKNHADGWRILDAR